MERTGLAPPIANRLSVMSQSSSAEEISRPSTGQHDPYPADVLPSSEAVISDAGESAHQAGDMPHRDVQHHRLSAAVTQAQPKLPESDAEQSQLDALDEEINRMDPASDGYAQRMRELSKLCGTFGRLPRSCVLHNDLTLRGDCPHSYGGFSDVWMAQYGVDRAAVKVLRAHVGDQLALKKAFYCEVTYWKRLRHPHIVTFLGVSSVFQLSIVSEWMDNGDLMSYLEAHPGTERLPLIVQISSAMEYIHASLVVHGDIKGRNVLINSHGQACLSDFGLAVTVYHTQSMDAMRSSTGSSTSPGTIRWSAPERLMSTDDPRHTMPTMSSDVYSFGITMWEVYNQQTPFSNLKSEWLVIPQICNGLRPQQSSRIPDCVWSLMEVCWSQERHDRPSSAILVQWLRKELERVKARLLRAWDPFAQAATEMADKFSQLFPPLKRAVATLLITLESLREVEDLEDDFRYVAHRLAIMKTTHENQISQRLIASKRMNPFLEGMIQIIQTVEKTVKIKSDRGILNDIRNYRNDIKAISNALCMIGDVAKYFVLNVTVSKHAMIQEQVDHELNLAATAQSLSVINLQQCTEGTRLELLTDMLAWATAASEVPMAFLLTGPAGSGKSTIAHTICSILQQVNLLAGRFFCTRDDDNEHRSTHYIFFTLAQLLVNHNRECAEALFHILRKALHAGRFVASMQLADLILKPIRSVHYSQQAPVARIPVLIIDALDQCANDEKMAYDLMCTLLAQCDKLPLKFLITSRPESCVTRAFDQAEPGRCICYRIEDTPENIARDDVLTYVRSELAQYAQAFCISNEWPPDVQVQTLAKQAGTLFIYASTACKYIENSDASKRLEDVTTLGVHHMRGVDTMYEFVLDRVRQSKDDAIWKITRRCLQALVRLKWPFSLVNLADFMGVERQRLRIVLAGLQPVLSIPSCDHPTAIFVSHTSFSDYLLDTTRSQNCPWFMKSTIVHAYMLRRCLACMNAELCFNISNSSTSYISNSQQPVQHSISATLHYSCLHWIDHLEGCDEIGSAEMTGLCEVMYKQFLYWLEVLSSTSSVHAVPSIMTRLLAWILRDVSCSSCAHGYRDLEQFAVHAKAFAEAFMVPISSSCPHIYLSALATASRRSKVWSAYSNKFNNLLCTVTLQPCDVCFLFVSRGFDFLVPSVLFSPDGMRIVSGCSNGTIRIWNPATGIAIGRPLRGHEAYVSSVAFSPNGTQIASGSFDRTIRLWNAATGETIGQPVGGHEDCVRSIAFSPDGMRIVSSSSDKTIRLWDAATGVAIGKPLCGHEDSVRSVDFSPDGTRIVSGSDDQTIRLWDADTGDSIGHPLRGHKGCVRCVRFSPHGTHIVSGSDDQTIRLWNAATAVAVGEPLRGHKSYVLSVGFSPNGARIVSGSSDKTIRVWDAVTGFAIGQPLRGHTDWVQSVGFSPDGTRIVSGSDDQTIRLWNVATVAATREPLRGHTDLVGSVAFSPDGMCIVSSSDDQTIRLWDATTGAAIGEPLRGHEDQVWLVTFSPDGTHIVSSSRDKTIRLWDAATGVAVREPMCGHENVVGSVAFSPDGTRIVSGSLDRSIRMWDAATGAAVGEPIQGHVKGVSSVVFSPDGTRIVSGSGDKTIRLWDADTGESIGQPLCGHEELIQSVRFSPDGARVISGSDDKTIRQWDAATGAVIGEPMCGHEDVITSVAFSPDGMCIISGSRDKTIRLWDATTGESIGQPLRGHEGCVQHVAFSPDGTRVASCSDDCTIRLWNVATAVGIAEPLHGRKDGAVLLALSADGAEILSASSKDLLHSLNANSFDPLQSSFHESHHLAVNAEPHARLLTPMKTSNLDIHPTLGAQANRGALFPGAAHFTFTSSLGADGRGPRDILALDEDGWLRGPNGELFLWILPEYRFRLRRPGMTTITTGTHPVMLDLSRFVHGNDWTKCFTGDPDDL